MDLQEFLKKKLEESVEDAFTATISLTPQLTDKTVMSEEECIICSIGFTGTIDGSFSICLSYSSAKVIVSKMLQSDMENMSDDIIDGISEQINMIAGGVKMKLSGEEHGFEIGIPTTIKGNRMVILSDFSRTHMITLNYDFDGISFSASLLYKIHKSKEEKKVEKEKVKLEALARLSQLEGM